MSDNKIREKEELLAKVRKIEIKTKGLSNQIFAGKYHSAFKGRGMSFSEVREYRIGDDVRDIDWNVTARVRTPHIKLYEEERELTMMLLVDVSASRMFGTTDKFKKDVVTEIAAVLSFSAAQNNDKIGVIFFSDKIEKYIPPKKGRTHVLRIISELLEFAPESKGTDVGVALQFMTNVLKKHATVFVLSDFMDVNVEEGSANYDKALRIAASKHDVVAVRTYDKREIELPNVGLLTLKDNETGEIITVDTSSRRVREHYAEYGRKSNDIINTVFTRYKIDSTLVTTDEDYVKALIRLFASRL